MNHRHPSFLSIRAAVVRPPGGRLKIERLKMEGPRDEEVLVRLAASGICHTDIDSSDGATGAVGLAAVMAGRIACAGIIIAVDIVPWRLKLALELGAAHRIDNRNTDLAKSIADITGGGVDYIVETSGALISEAADLLNPRGAAALLTSASGPGRTPGGRRVISVIQGDAVPQQFIPKLIRFYQAGRFPFDRLVKFYRFTEINRAIADAKRGDTIKPVLRMGKQT